MIDFSHDHLKWQIEKASFEDVGVEFRQFHHNPHAIHYRFLEG